MPVVPPEMPVASACCLYRFAQFRHGDSRQQPISPLQVFPRSGRRRSLYNYMESSTDRLETHRTERNAAGHDTFPWTGGAIGDRVGFYPAEGSVLGFDALIPGSFPLSGSVRQPSRVRMSVPQDTQQSATSSSSLGTAPGASGLANPGAYLPSHLVREPSLLSSQRPEENDWAASDCRHLRWHASLS